MPICPLGVWQPKVPQWHAHMPSMPTPIEEPALEGAKSNTGPPETHPNPQKDCTQADRRIMPNGL